MLSHTLLHVDLEVVVGCVVQFRIVGDVVEVAELTHILVVEHEVVGVRIAILAAVVGHEFPSLLWSDVITEAVWQVRLARQLRGSPGQFHALIACAALGVLDVLVCVVITAHAEVDGSLLAPVFAVEVGTHICILLVEVVLVCRCLDRAGLCALGGYWSLLDVEFVTASCESCCETKCCCGKCTHEHLLYQILLCCHNFIFLFNCLYLFILLFSFLFLLCPFSFSVRAELMK